MSKVRVYEVAKQLNLDPKAVVALFQQVGVPDVRNHMSSVEPEAVERVKRHLEKSKTHDVVEERVRSDGRVIKRRAIAKPATDTASAPAIPAPPASTAAIPSARESSREVMEALRAPIVERVEREQNGHAHVTEPTAPERESGAMPVAREVVEDRASARDVARARAGRSPQHAHPRRARARDRARARGAARAPERPRSRSGARAAARAGAGARGRRASAPAARRSAPADAAARVGARRRAAGRAASDRRAEDRRRILDRPPRRADADARERASHRHRWRRDGRDASSRAVRPARRRGRPAASSDMRTGGPQGARGGMMGRGGPGGMRRGPMQMQRKDAAPSSTAGDGRAQEGHPHRGEHHAPGDGPEDVASRRPS